MSGPSNSLHTCISKLLLDEDYLFLDCGAAIGIPPRWEPYKDYLKFLRIEPQGKFNQYLPHTSDSLIFLADTLGDATFYESQSPHCSSLKKPNLDIIRKFSQLSNLMDVKMTRPVRTTTLDSFLDNQSRPNFIKVDCEGSSFEILNGAMGVLRRRSTIAVEAEVEFQQIRRGGHLFGQVNDLLSQSGLTFQGFTSMNPSERDRARGFGTLLHADALWIREPEDLELCNTNGSTDFSLIKKAAFTYAIYNRPDLLTYLDVSSMSQQYQGIVYKTIKLLEGRLRRLSRVSSCIEFAYSLTKSNVQSRFLL